MCIQYGKVYSYSMYTNLSFYSCQCYPVNSHMYTESRPHGVHPMTYSINKY